MQEAAPSAASCFLDPDTAQMDLAAAFALLGLAPTEDLPAIKRAYAARLRVTRPDEDAPAFQQLSEGYALVLEWVRGRRAPPSTGGSRSATTPEAVLALLHELANQRSARHAGTAAPPAAPGPLPEAPPERAAALIAAPEALPVAPPQVDMFDAIAPATESGPLAAQIVARAQWPGIDEPWLDAWPELVHLQTRAQVGHHVAALLDASDILPDAVDLCVLSRFFHWEIGPVEGTGPAARVLQRLRAEAQLRAEAGIPELVDEPGYIDGQVARLLLSPFQWWPQVRMALDYPERVLDRLARLRLESDCQERRILPPATLDFWQELASGRTWCRPVLQLCLVQAVAGWLVFGALNWMNADGLWRFPPFIQWAWFPLLLPLMFGAALGSHHHRESSRALRRRAVRKPG